MIVKCTTDMDQYTHMYIYIYTYILYIYVYFKIDTFKISIYLYSINEYVYSLQSILRSTCKRLNTTCFRHTCIQSQNKTKQTSGKSFHTCFLVAGFFLPRYDVELSVWVAFQRMFMPPSRTWEIFGVKQWVSPGRVAWGNGKTWIDWISKKKHLGLNGDLHRVESVAPVDPINIFVYRDDSTGASWSDRLILSDFHVTWGHPWCR